jgi:hypothetical protein
MNLLDLTPEQLKRAAAIKEQIEVLNKELRRVFDGAIDKWFCGNQEETDHARSSKKENRRRSEGPLGEA